MASSSFIRRIQRVSSHERIQLGEALLALTVASAAIKFIPFRLVVHLMNYGRSTAKASREQMEMLEIEITCALQRAKRIIPWRIVCFPEGLAAHWMLRRRRAASFIHYGLHQFESKLSAHVWVSLGGKVVVGQATKDSYTCVAVFPSHSNG